MASLQQFALRSACLCWQGWLLLSRKTSFSATLSFCDVAVFQWWVLWAGPVLYWELGLQWIYELPARCCFILSYSNNPSTSAREIRFTSAALWSCCHSSSFHNRKGDFYRRGLGPSISELLTCSLCPGSPASMTWLPAWYSWGQPKALILVAASLKQEFLLLLEPSTPLAEIRNKRGLVLNFCLHRIL